MFFKRIVYTVFVMFFFIVGYSKADNLDKAVYSTVSLPITLFETVKCDRVKAQFEVYAEGDSYSMALKRLKNVSNSFMEFLKKHFSENEIQTRNIYGYSKNALVSVSIDTDKIKKMQSVIQYILNRNFEYKTGIKPTGLNLYISNELKQKTEDALFRQLLKISKEKLKETNIILGGGYTVKDININFNAYSPAVYRNSLTLYKSASIVSKSGINISQGSKKIKLSAKLKMIKKR